MKLKGALYRKLKEMERKKAVEREERFPLPSFERVSKFPELPRPKNLKDVNVTYPLIEGYVLVRVVWDKEEKILKYEVLEPSLSEEERKLLSEISENLMELIEVSPSLIKEEKRMLEYLREKVVKIIEDLGLDIGFEAYEKLMYFVYRDFVGMGKIEPLMLDPFIEDISCDGINVPVYIVHRVYGSLKTNVVFETSEELSRTIIKMAEKCGRYVSYAEPILEGTLPDGSRVSATLAPDVATKGGAFTIRKFREKPFSPIDQMELGTASAEVLAYFWEIIEHKLSILVIGGTASGKTSFLNALCMFIPREAKIVSIEDTRELRLVHEHWLPGLARVGFGMPLPTGEKYGAVTLFDLLKESFRQNPDYVVVGETRGEETFVMFQGMSAGHPCLSTFHAGSVDTAVKRLTSPPINLPATHVESLNVIAVLTLAKEKGPTARRVKEVVEIVSVDPRTGEVSTNVVFRWNPAVDKIEKVGESVMIRRIATSIGTTEEKILEEVERKKVFLERLRERGVRDYREVCEFINKYYKNPQEAFLELEKGVSVTPSEERKIRPTFKPRLSVWELLKILRSKV